MNAEFEMVKEFHRAFEHPISEVPVMLIKERLQKRIDWCADELIELWDAQTLVKQIDANMDLLYFALGNLVEMGVPPALFFQCVHLSNMAKLFPDGKSHKDANGKTIKPECWRPPESAMEVILRGMFLGQIK